MKDPHLEDSLFGDEPERRPEHAAAQPPPRNRREHREHVDYGDPFDEEPRQPRRWIPIVIALALVVGGGGIALKTLGLGVPSLSLGSSDEGDYSGEGHGSAEVKVSKGDTGYDIGASLADAGVVKSASTFAAVFGADPEAAKVRPGTYAMRKEMSSSSALALMLDPSSRQNGGVTIPEGLWASEIFERLSKATGQPVADYKKVKSADLGLPAGAEGNMEGYLFPSTYEFSDDESASDQLKRMVTEFEKQVKPLGISPAEMHRTVTIASIVQSESPGGQDDDKVARVILNRMQDGGETAGKLQMDSSIHFALKKRGTITTSDQDRAVKSPYNTYEEQGLPPGPISNPGLAALKAASNPAEGDWIYFVTVNPETGQTKFATDKNGHDANVREFQAWCKKNDGKC
ncbi:endolytic transglycosylase MltG [Demetria terragena]|uniref:endolytic transglycosylase MltG n=1 Tax=Demetria terragena TaxID=63959 RepID=UPI00035D1330|nr:endolytic transglycosylase MltG [Demetria terragena]